MRARVTPLWLIAGGIALVAAVLMGAYRYSTLVKTDVTINPPRDTGDLCDRMMADCLNDARRRLADCLSSGDPPSDCRRRARNDALACQNDLRVCKRCLVLGIWDPRCARWIPIAPPPKTSTPAPIFAP